MFFSISTAYNRCYIERFPIGFIDTTMLNQQYKKWFTTGEKQIIKYAGKLVGLKLYIEMFGETRTYRKSQNYFHTGIDNFDTTKCQIEPLLALDRNLNNLNDTIVYNFLKTFSVICEANVEFSEWSNELLFKTLDKDPELVLQVISSNYETLDTTSIFLELQSPLHDLVPTDNIKNKVSVLEVDEQIKSSVLRRLMERQ